MKLVIFRFLVIINCGTAFSSDKWSLDTATLEDEVIVESQCKIVIPDNLIPSFQVNFVTHKIKQYKYDELFSVIRENFNLLKSLNIIGNNHKDTTYTNDIGNLCVVDLLKSGILDAKQYDWSGVSMVHYYLSVNRTDLVKAIFEIKPKDLGPLLNMPPYNLKKNIAVYDPTETIGTLLQQRYPDLYNEITEPLPKDVHVSPNEIYDDDEWENNDQTKYSIVIPEDIQSDKVKECITQEISYFSYYDLQDVIECNIDLLKQHELVGNYTETGTRLFALYLIDLIEKEIIPLDKLDNSSTSWINQKFLIEVLLERKNKSVLE